MIWPAIMAPDKYPKKFSLLLGVNGFRAPPSLSGHLLFSLPQLFQSLCSLNYLSVLSIMVITYLAAALLILSSAQEEVR